MQKYKITKVFINDKSKDGKVFKTGAGKPFWKIAIKTEETGEPYLTDLIFNQDDPRFEWVEAIKNGAFQDVLVVWHDEATGYWNFKLPTWKDDVNDRIQRLEKKVFGKNDFNEA